MTAIVALLIAPFAALEVIQMWVKHSRKWGVLRSAELKAFDREMTRR